jgi:cytoskeletal protein CcmA (bactofilin family)
MALFGKERERNERPRSSGPEPLAPAAGATPREVEMFERDRDVAKPEEATGTSAFLGKGSRVTGKLAFEGPARIEGHVEGEISAQDTLVIGESAVVNAQIVGSAVVVHGKVTGDVTARKKLEIRAPGKLFGNITTPSLVIHEGVVFEGQCTMGGTETQRAADKDRKVAFFPKEERPADTAAGGLKAHSELAK